MGEGEEEGGEKMYPVVPGLSNLTEVIFFMGRIWSEPLSSSSSSPFRWLHSKLQALLSGPYSAIVPSCGLLGNPCFFEVIFY